MGPEITLADCQKCPMRPERILLRFPHGLGDAVAFTAVLAHLKKHRPGMSIALDCNPKYATLFTETGISLAQAAQTGGQKRIVAWKEGHLSNTDLPPTKVVRCLLEEFGIRPETDLLRYQFSPSEEAKEQARAFLDTLDRKKGVVAIHHRGNQCQHSKTIPDGALIKLCGRLEHLGYLPLLLTEEMGLGIDGLAAFLGMTTLNIMADSGPQKLAMTTAVPLLSVWTQSHPVHYVDTPGTNVHLVPANHADYLVQSNGVQRDGSPDMLLAFFRAKYRHHVYTDLGQGLVDMADYLLCPEEGKPCPTEPTGESVPVIPAMPTSTARKLTLACGLPPGDVMTMTAAVQVLHEQYPGQYLTAVDTPHCKDCWDNNHNVVEAGDNFERVEMQYHLVNESGNRPVHFIQGYAEFLADSLRIPLRMTTNRPHLYLSDEEKGWMNQVWETTGANTPYWVINAGVKRDYPAKQYPFFQEVVDLLRGRVRFAQVGVTSDLHVPLKGVINLLDQTSQRALFRLIYHAQGVLSGVSLPMHVAAAFEKPAVIVAGGREPRLWNSYPYQTLLATTGSMDCCKNGGCWKSRITPEQNDGKREGLCVRPMPTVPPAGECMTRISPEMVAEAVKSYL